MATIPRTAQSKFCIIVAGMHRSGTSATARVVNLLGANITRDLLPAVPDDNDRGFWESRAVVNIHDNLLHSFGANWDSPFALPKGWLKTKCVLECKRQLADKIENDFHDNDIFVVKDPRIARLLPMWIELLDELSIESVVVIPFRNPLEVADSLHKRNSLSLEQSLVIYAWSYLDSEFASRKTRRLFVSYEQMLQDWRAFAARLMDLVGKRLGPATPEQEAAIEGFLTSELHHNRRSYEELVAVSGPRGIAAEIFSCLSEAATTGHEGNLQNSFDFLRAGFEQTSRLFESFLKSKTEQLRKEGDHIRAEAVAHAEAARTQVLVARAETEQLQKEKERIRAEVAAHAEAARTQVLAARAETEQLQAERDHIRAEAIAQAEAARTQVLAARAETEQLQAERDHIRAEAIAQAEAARTQVLTARAETEQLQAERDHIRAEAIAQAEAARTQVLAARAETEQLQKEKERIRVEAAAHTEAARTQVLAARAEIEHLQVERDHIRAEAMAHTEATRLQLLALRAEANSSAARAIAAEATAQSTIEEAKMAQIQATVFQAKADARATSLQDELTISRDRIAELSVELDVRIRENFGLRSSTSWRITRPLRWLVAAMRHLTNRTKRIFG